MRQEKVTVDGDVTFAYCELGEGPPVVCLPGWSQAAEQFVSVMERLAPGRRRISLALWENPERFSEIVAQFLG
jgi:pimeloyl-ACP methyl ester carboxylesterase